jgi:hypothetical protein
MDYFYTTATGETVRLALSSKTKKKMVFVDAVVASAFRIPAATWVEDLLAEVAASGRAPSSALSAVLEEYRRTHGPIKREPLTPELLQRCTESFEAWRLQAVADQEESWWNSPVPFDQARTQSALEL